MPPASLNTRMRLRSSMKAAVSARLAEPGRFSTTRRSPLLHDPARAAGDFGDLVVAEALHQLVERAGHRRQGGELLDQPVAALDGLAAFDRLAVAHDGPREEISFPVGEGLVELDRKGMREIVEDVFARREIDLDVVPVFGRNLGKAALHQRFAGRDDLDDAAWPSPRSRSMRRSSVGVFIEVRRCPKKRCLADSNADRAAALALRFSVPPCPTMLVALSAASRLLWMMAKAPA